MTCCSGTFFSTASLRQSSNSGAACWMRPLMRDSLMRTSPKVVETLTYSRGKNAAVGGGRAHAESCRLREDQRCECVGVLRLAQHRQQRARTILFHLHRRGVNIERARGQGLLEKVAVDLRIHVVEIGFDDGDFFVEAGDSFSAGWPIMMRTTLGWPSRSAVPAP